MESKNYSEIIDGFQIRDVTYIFGPPVDAPIMFDIVKWVTCEPYKCTDLLTGKEEIHTKYCYSVAHLVWDKKERAFDFKSIGLRWLEAKPTEAIIDEILKFVKEKTEILAEKELSDEDE